ncbi:MAG: hypothetical protein WCK76_13125, partial [Elusimicrobiota bacterium]
MTLLAAVVSFSLAGGAFGDDFGNLSGDLSQAISESRAGGSNSVIQPAIEVAPVYSKSRAAAPKDDLKAAVIKHLDENIAYCDRNKDDCNGANNWLRDFAKTIGNGRCNNRGYNCVNGVLETCKGVAENDDV